MSRAFVNEERFAKQYASGRFRMKQWGKVKIILELKKRQISTYSINKAIEVQRFTKDNVNLANSYKTFGDIYKSKKNCSTNISV